MGPLLEQSIRNSVLYLLPQSADDLDLGIGQMSRTTDQTSKVSLLVERRSRYVTADTGCESSSRKLQIGAQGTKQVSTARKWRSGGERRMSMYWSVLKYMVLKV